MPENRDRDRDDEGIRARGEQALGEFAQALFDNPMFGNALSAASEARGRALEAQRAAMEALNLPSAGDVERLQRRLRSLSDRLEENEEQLDDALREIGSLRRELADRDKPEAPPEGKD